MLSSKWGISISLQSASLRLKDHPERRGRKNVRAEIWEGMWRNVVFYIWHGYQINELIAAEVPSTQCGQDLRETITYQGVVC